MSTHSRHRLLKQVGLVPESFVLLEIHSSPIQKTGHYYFETIVDSVAVAVHVHPLPPSPAETGWVEVVSVAASFRWSSCSYSSCFLAASCFVAFAAASCSGSSFADSSCWDSSCFAASFAGSFVPSYSAFAASYSSDSSCSSATDLHSYCC